MPVVDASPYERGDVMRPYGEGESGGVFPVGALWATAMPPVGGWVLGALAVGVAGWYGMSYDRLIGVCAVVTAATVAVWWGIVAEMVALRPLWSPRFLRVCAAGVHAWTMVAGVALGIWVHPAHLLPDTWLAWMGVVEGWRESLLCATLLPLGAVVWVGGMALLVAGSGAAWSEAACGQARGVGDGATGQGGAAQSGAGQGGARRKRGAGVDGLRPGAARAGRREDRWACWDMVLGASRGV